MSVKILFGLVENSFLCARIKNQHSKRFLKSYA